MFPFTAITLLSFVVRLTVQLFISVVRGIKRGAVLSSHLGLLLLFVPLGGWCSSGGLCRLSEFELRSDRGRLDGGRLCLNRLGGGNHLSRFLKSLRRGGEFQGHELCIGWLLYGSGHSETGLGWLS